MNRADEFDVVIRRKNNVAIAGIPHLGLYAKGNDTNAALAALEAKKVAFVSDLEEAGELGMLDLGEPQRTRGHVSTTGPAAGLGLFALKACIVGALIVAAFVISGVLIASKAQLSIAQTVDTVKSIKIGGAPFWKKVEAELDRMASPESDLPEAKKQKLLADIRAISTKWRPFIGEIQAALNDPTVPPPIAAPTHK